ncbi:hypothetical protein EEAAV_10170 [Rahnella aceris]
MDKQEPRIISPGYSDNELVDWLEGKVRAARQLHALLNEKAIHEERLSMLVTEISALSQKATIEVLREEQLAEDGCVSEGIYSSHPDLLQVSSVILKVVKAELERQNVQPSVENIRCVLALIDGSMPAFAL